MKSALNDVKSALSAWLKDRLPHVRPGRPDDIHIDDLLRRCGQKVTHAFQDSLEPYSILVDLLDKKANEIMAQLFIPLKSSKRLQLRVPDLKGIDEELSNISPSLYLVDRESCKFVSAIELHRYPIDFSPFREPRDDIFFCYEECRSVRDRAWGWEYSRAIVASHYPKTLIFPAS